MALRDLAITLIVFGFLPIILWRPYIGILVWSWLSYMNPHRQTWGFAYDMPFAQIVAITLLVAMIFSKERYRLRVNGAVGLWLAYLGWMLVSTTFALYPDRAMILLIKIVKIQLVTFLTLILINDRRKLDQLIWVIVVSIGFYSVKGGIFTLATGGAFRVYGPPDSYIQENNALAVAALMIVPLFFYLQHVYRKKLWLRYGLLASAVLTAIAAFGSQSRGALIAIAALAFFYWLKSQTKLISGIAIILGAIMIIPFMPESWHARMDTIVNYEQDMSAMQRLNAWQYSINVASDRLTGGGLQSWHRAAFNRWAPDPSNVHAAHSIYFSVLADHGWPGLIMYVSLLFLTWRSLSRVIKLTKGDLKASSENMLARMLQVSLIAFMSGGAFLSLAYFDLPWHIIAIAFILEELVKRQQGATTGVPAALQPARRGV